MLVPDWPAPAGVQALCSTRAGGVSGPPWDSLNLGLHVGDDPLAVAVNRQRLTASIGAARPVFLRQVHGHAVAHLRPDTPEATEADACVSTDVGVACTIMVADCLPVLLCDARGRAVAAAHAGWRGLAGTGGHGVIEAVVEALASVVAAGQADADADADAGLLAWLGPCIGPSAFEVGDEVKAAFEAADGGAAAHFQRVRPGKWLADLQALARRRLQASGVTRIHGNDGSTGWCTLSNSSRFFSHRRDRISGRFAASIWRV